MVCIKAGAIRASTDDATAPISDMKSSIFGMAAARATSWKEKESIILRLDSYLFSDIPLISNFAMINFNLLTC